MTGTLDDVCYTTRERVQDTLEQSDAVRNNRRIDDCIRAASRDISGELHRNFWPQYGTRYPNVRWVRGGRTLWLNHVDYEVLSLTSVVVDGVTWTENTHYYLDMQIPYGSGAYVALRIPNTAAVAWSSLDRGIALTGFFGGSNGSDAAGTLAAAITTTTALTMSVSDASLVGVGDLILIDSERVIVTEKTMLTTTATVTGSVASSNATTTVPVSDGTLIHAGEQILIGSERMFVENVTGNNLTVKRAVQASVLAAHASPDVIYAPRTCTIRRGAAGTTAATHLNAAALARNAPPTLIGEGALALATNYAEQGKSGYARVVGAGDNARQATGAGVNALTEDLYTAFGRKGRIG